MSKFSFSLLSTVILFSPASVLADVSDWEIFPSVHTVRALIRVGSDLWGATNSGLFRFDLESETFQTFSNADGLSTNDIRAMTLDGRGNLILGMGNAYIDIFNLTTHQVKSIPDFYLENKIFQIYALYNDGGDIYVGTDIGVSRLAYFDNLGKYLVDGNYNNLGEFSSEITVKAIRVFNQGLWVGTPEGVARGDLTAPVLEAPTSWINFTTSEGLSSNDVSTIEIFRDTLYVAAANTGLNRLIDSTFVPLNISSTNQISFLKAYQDTLYFGRPGGIYRLQENQIFRYGTYQAKGLTVEFGADGVMWAGMQLESSHLGGLQKLTGSEWSYNMPEGPRAEVFTDLLVEEDGSLWATGWPSYGPTNGGLFHFDGQHWISLTRQYDVYTDSNFVSPDSFFWYATTSITLDDSGWAWVGTHGRGVGWFEFNADTIEGRAFYSTPSGRLFGIASAPSYCVVRDVLTDEWGNVWICNSEADVADGGPVAIVPTDFIQDSAAFPNWHYLTPLNEFGSPIQNAAFYVDRIAEDSYGRKWFGANNNTGQDVYILDDNGTPFNKDDDVWTQIPDLPSDSVTAIVCDRDGVVWVGTGAGVEYFYPHPDPDYLVGVNLVVPVSQYIKTIAVDPQNNKWFGTNNGISVLGADNYTWLANYTTSSGPYPSPLPGDNVQAIAFDARTGYAYLGTDNGLARLNTPYKAMGATITSVSVWPNPFLISEGTDARLFFDPTGLTETTEIKIFTAAGLLVRRLPDGIISNINLGWDGRNFQQEMVGTGIYLLLAYTSDGQSQVGKVAVIHK